MRRAIVIAALFFYLPVNVLAHGAYIKWSQISSVGMIEWLEATLVVAALSIYLLTMYHHAIKAILAKSKRFKK